MRAIVDGLRAPSRLMSVVNIHIVSVYLNGGVVIL